MNGLSHKIGIARRRVACNCSGRALVISLATAPKTGENAGTAKGTGNVRIAAMSTIPVRKTIAYAYTFTFAHLGTVIGLTWVPVALGAVILALAYDFCAGQYIAYLRDQNPGELGPAF